MCATKCKMQYLDFQSLGFKKIFILFVYLAALGLSCGMQDLH